MSASGDAQIAYRQLREWCKRDILVFLTISNGGTDSEWFGRITSAEELIFFEDLLGIFSLKFSLAVFSKVCLDSNDSEVTVKCLESPDGDNIEICNVQSGRDVTQKENSPLVH
jgi:hypothetical protein